MRYGKIFNPDDFISFEQPNYLKGLMGFFFTPYEDKTLVTTETRMYSVDEKLKRKFNYY